MVRHCTKTPRTYQRELLPFSMNPRLGVVIDSEILEPNVNHEVSQRHCERSQTVPYSGAALALSVVHDRYFDGKQNETFVFKISF